jgi:hypothetical protein
VSTAKLVLTIDHDGTGRCLYSELIDLRALGSLTCQRASHIEFDARQQDWKVLAADRRRVLFRDPSRQACLDWEQDHLQP